MTTTEDRPATEIGNPRRRKEDARLITGRTRWTDNIVLPGMLHLAMVRSPFAHARITAIDTTAARAATGVIAVLTGADIADEQGGLPNAWAVVSDQKAPVHPSMAVDHVAFAGEIVAMVIARNAAEANDAADLVDVDYEELAPALDLRAAAADEVIAHPDLGTNVSAVWSYDSAEAGTGDDVDAAIAAARDGGIVIEKEIRQQRLIPAFMEPRAIVVDPTTEQMTVWSSTQVPHFVKIFIALVLGIPEHKIRVIAPDVGGGFGGKLQFTPEEVLTVIAARHTGKPCKYNETRSESLMAAHHGRDQWQKLTLAANADGTVTGLKVDLIANMGAYLGLVTSAIPLLGAFMYNGIYKFPSYRLGITNVFTNTTWTDAYRGAGRPEATFAIERLMDELAARVGVDPLEIRERNWIKHEEFPFNTVSGLRLRLRQLRGRDREGARALQVRRTARGAGGAPGVRRSGPARHRCLDVHRDVRTGAVALARLDGVRRRRLGARVGPDAADREGRGGRPGRARTARGTRPRGASWWPIGSASPSRTSRSCTATRRSPRGAWTRTGLARWRSAGWRCSPRPTR